MALAGLSFALHGLPVPRTTTLRNLILENGGSISAAKVTHLVTTEKEIASNSFKVKQARQQGAEVVTEDFIHELVANAPPPESLVPSTPTRGSPSRPVRGGRSISPKRRAEAEAPAPVFTQRMTAPLVNMVLPDTVSTACNVIKVAVVGLNFEAAGSLVVSFGPLTCTEIEYHCSTVVIATLSVPPNTPAGTVYVSASNDGGRHFGVSTSFRFSDPGTAMMLAGVKQDQTMLFAGQMSNLRRSIRQLEEGLVNVQRLESQLADQTGNLPQMLGVSIVQQRGVPLITSSTNATVEPSSSGVVPTGGSGVAPMAVGPVANKTNVLAAAAKNDDREIRLFISSPFKDMQEERDLLVKRIIPKIRRMCIERNVEFNYVDLRWGVTGVQNEQAATLLMCLREIEKCNLFIGAWGERYGWCLSEDAERRPSAADELLKKSLSVATGEFPWLQNYKDRSVTEIEMRMIMHHTSPVRPAYFYLRDPYYVESIPENKRTPFVSEGEFYHAKLDKLKADITGSSFPSRQYKHPQQMFEQLSAELENHVNTLYPAGSKLSDIERERFRHRAYAKSVSRVYLQDEKNFMALDKYVSNAATNPLTVVGEPGIGKSALVANWARAYAQHHPEDAVIVHFIGCTATSVTIAAMLTRVLQETQELTGDFSSTIPSNPEQLVAQFPHLLEKMLASNKVHRLVVVLDGLDHLDARDGAHELLWLPGTLPARVKMVLSTCPNNMSSTLTRRNVPSLTLSGLNEGERVSFIRSYLNLSSKRLSEQQEFRLAAARQAGTPRYLKTLLEDISLWGQFEKLDERIALLVAAKNTAELYDIVLARLEADYDQKGSGSISQFLSLIWAARRGLFVDTELGPMMEERGFSQSDWSQLVVVLEDLLLSSGGLLSFSNDDIRKAVEMRYLANEGKKREAHAALATFFTNIRDLTARKVEELPHQLMNAEAFTDLRKCLCDLSIFIKLYSSSSKFDLYKYWRSISSKFDVGQSYVDALEYSAQFPTEINKADVYYRVGYFLEDFGKYQAAADMFMRARHFYSTGAQVMDVANMDYSLGRIYTVLSRYEEAEAVLLSAKQLYTRERGPDDLEVSHVELRLAALYTMVNRLKEGETSILNCLRIRQNKLGDKHSRVGQALKHMITLYEQTGDLAKSIKSGEDALKITELEYGLDHVQVAYILVRLGHVQMIRQKYNEAKTALDRALSIDEVQLGPSHPATADVMYELGCFYFMKPEDVGRPEQAWNRELAEQWFKKALAIKIEALGRDHPDVSRLLCRMGSLYIERTEFLTAEQYLNEALAIRTAKLGPMHSRVGQVMKHLMTLYELQEEFDKAVEAGQRALDIERALYGPRSKTCSFILIRIAQIHFLREGYTGRSGVPLFQEAMSIQEVVFGPDSKEVKETRELLASLSSPPKAEVLAPVQMPAVGGAAPPPPPPMPALDIKDLKKNMATDRAQLLNAIQKRGEARDRKEAAKEAELVHKVKKHGEVKKKSYDQGGWWKQNYDYARNRAHGGNDLNAQMSNFVKSNKPAIQQHQMQMQQQAQMQQQMQQQQVFNAPPPNYGYSDRTSDRRDRDRDDRSRDRDRSERRPPTKPSLFNNDADDDLFGGPSRNNKKPSSSRNNANLFDDDDFANNNDEMGSVGSALSAAASPSAALGGYMNVSNAFPMQQQMPMQQQYGGYSSPYNASYAPPMPMSYNATPDIFASVSAPSTVSLGVAPPPPGLTKPTLAPPAPAAPPMPPRRR